MERAHWNRTKKNSPPPPASSASQTLPLSHSLGSTKLTVAGSNAEKMSGLESHVTVQKRAFYAPPWADVSIIGVAGSSGSGKSTISQAIVKKLNLPWVVILSMA